jgi:hypothetical protein
MNIPDEELIRDVIAVAKKLRKKTVKKSEYSEHGTYNTSTLKYRFRSWVTVLQLAGLEPSRTPMNVPEELLLKNFEDVWNYLERQPTSDDLAIKSRARSQYCSFTYRHHFGSWWNMLKKFEEYQKSKAATGSGQMQKQVKFFNRLSNIKDKKSKYNQPTITLDLKMSVIMRDGFRCQRCGSSPFITAGLELNCQHIVPWPKGGKTVKDNLRTVCSQCKQHKGNKSRSGVRTISRQSIKR